MSTTTNEARDFLGQLSQLHRGDAAPRKSGRSKLTNFFDDFRADSGFGASPFSDGGGSRGGYVGGQRNRLTGDWAPGRSGPNRLFEQDGELLRQRAWDLYYNNPAAQSAIDAYISNVIERGIVPERDDEDWERAWRRWGGLTPHATRECDLTRDQSIYELQATWLREVLVGGGCLTHYVDVPRRSQRVPLAIELIPEERFATHLQTWGSNPKTANRVVNGIELDPATGRTVAYHVYVRHPDDGDADPLRTTRLLAESCEYGYFKDRVGAKRGTTLMKPMIIWLWGWGYYTDNEVAASNMKSSWAYVIEHEDGPPALNNGSGAVLTDLRGNPIDYHERAMVLNGSGKITPVGPNVPGSDSLPWIEMLQRSIAIGAKLSYEEVFRDYSKGSFSSVRMARGQDKKRYTPMQQFTINHFGNPTVRRFDLAASGALIPGLPSPEQLLRDSDQLWDDQIWQTPGWESPNPKDDALADDVRLKNRTITRATILGREGKSAKKEFRQMEAEFLDMEARGILPVAEQAAITAEPPVDPLRDDDLDHRTTEGDR